MTLYNPGDVLITERDGKELRFTVLGVYLSSKRTFRGRTVDMCQVRVLREGSSLYEVIRAMPDDQEYLDFIGWKRIPKST